MQLSGIHHLTAVSADIRKNHRFYTQTLGMRLVKRSVNQDDVSAYHLFYADAIGTPGTDLTFFDWRMPAERRGTHSIVRTSLRVRSPDDLDWWQRRLAESGVESTMVEQVARPALQFEDPEGQRLALVVDEGSGDEPQPWEASPVPPDRQIRGLGPIAISVPSLAGTAELLTNVMGMRFAGDYALGPTPEHRLHLFAMGDGGPHAELHVMVEPGLPPARLGAGGVHHVAFRVPNDEQHAAWVERLIRHGIANSGVVDRYYFRSLYFREPNGVLFELATDGPGFAVDEDPARLGEQVALPPFLEPHRSNIVANLRPID